jgi:hypothetical protein
MPYSRDKKNNLLDHRLMFGIFPRNNFISIRMVSLWESPPRTSWHRTRSLRSSSPKRIDVLFTFLRSFPAMSEMIAKTLRSSDQIIGHNALHCQGLFVHCNRTQFWIFQIGLDQMITYVDIYTYVYHRIQRFAYKLL